MANVGLPRWRLWAHTALVWFVVQALWLALVLSLLEGPGSGGLRGVLVAAAILVPPLGVGVAFLRWRRRRNDRLSEAEARLASSALTTRAGHRLVPAGGLTPDDPIVCLERDPARIPAAEREYLRERVAASAVVVGQALRQHRGRMLDVLTVEVDGLPREFHFDVTRSASFSA